MYFVTLCVHAGLPLFGEVRGGRMHLSEAGVLIRSIWTEIPMAYPEVALDAHQVMPDHLHGIVVLGQLVRSERSPSLGDVIRNFKSLTTRKYVDHVRRSGWPRFAGRLWQRDFHDHVIRSDGSRDAIRRYIAENPARWSAARVGRFDGDGA
jgi:REP element-mobilizing transposase RayT